MTNDARFVPLANYSSGFEADMVREQLEQAGIPVLVKALQGGIFGAGFIGPMAGGVVVHVPSPELARARRILGL